MYATKMLSTCICTRTKLKLLIEGKYCKKIVRSISHFVLTIGKGGSKIILYNTIIAVFDILNV